MLLTLAFLAQLIVVPKSLDKVPAPAPHVNAVGPTGRMALKWYTLSLVGTAPANGDTDLYADTDETMDVTLTLINKSGNLTDVVVTLTTGDPTIECVRTSQIVIGPVAAGATFTTPPFRFKVADASTVNRTDVDQVLDAHFNVGVRSAQFTALSRPIRFRLPLDMNASGSITQSAWIEDFEVPGSLGKFTDSDLDAGKNSLALADGMRCQFNDPDGPNSNSPGNADCFPGFPGEASENHWHLHEATLANGGVGRAYSGVRSLHYGEHSATTPAQDSTPMKSLDAVRSVPWINVPPAQFHPELVFAHQVSLLDKRFYPPLDPGESLDRAVVEVNVVQANGFDSPAWKKIEPYWNEYDHLGSDDFYNCSFDPTDDGNDEDDFFDPSDPARRLGPSSTCFPEGIFSDAGDIDYRFPAHPTRIGSAFDGPGLTGSIDVGTWVQPRFNLQEFAGRRIRLRFVASGLEVGSAEYWNEWFGNPPDFIGDDGWYIDQIHVSTALLSPLTISADTKAVSPLACGACGSITASLNASPLTLSMPGQSVTLDAGATTFDVCLNGPMQFQFWIDANQNGIAGDAGDTLLRDFDPDWKYTFALDQTSQIAVLAQCPSAPLCDAADGSNTALATVTVNCPSGVSRTAFPQTIRVDDAGGPGLPVLISWPVADSVDAVRGWLVNAQFPFTSLRDGGFTGSVVQCLATDSAPTESVYDNETLFPGAGFYYLVRRHSSTACAPVLSGYTTNAASERPGRDAEIDADPTAGTCP